MSTIPNTVSFGTRLRQLRTERKLPLRQIATLAEISAAHLSKIENGESQPTLPVLEKLAQAFGLSVDALISEQNLQKTMPASLLEFIKQNKNKYPELSDPTWQEALSNVRFRGAPPTSAGDWSSIFSAMLFAYRGTQNP